MGLLEQLAAELAAKGITGIATRDVPSGNPVGPYMHGPGGLFGQAGLERDVISTRVHPRGILSALPGRGTIDTNPLYAYITGFTAPTGTNPDGVCDDPMVAGAMKNCFQTAQLGRYSFQTAELELNRVGQRTNRGEFLDLRVMNGPLASFSGIEAPQVGGNPSLQSEVLQRFVTVGIAFQDKLNHQLWEGNPANNSAGGGYKEFPGLNILIGTNKVDAITSTACPSLDSDIKDFNYYPVDNTTSFAGGGIVNTLTYMMRQLRWNAERMNMNPVTWKIAMRPGLFYELTAVWPCQYSTYRCATLMQGDNTQLIVDSNDVIRARDDMRNNEYLVIDGVQFQVVLDDAITEETSGDNGAISEGCFASDIYIIPYTVRGGIAATYVEYLDYTRAAMVGAEEGNLSGTFFWTDGGRYLWHAKPPNNWCVQWMSKIEPRVVLLTPHLAGRITNIQYCPLQHTRDSYNDDPYFVNGGVTSREGYGPSFYSDWNLPA